MTGAAPMAAPAATPLAESASVDAARSIYLDHHATTPVDPRVAAVVVRQMLELYGNASSADHAFGDTAAHSVEVARAEVAALVGARPRAVTFTSGATESINLALLGLARAHRRRAGRPMRIALMPVEHRAVLEVCAALADAGDAELTWLPVDDRARLDLGALAAVCARGLDLVCVMGAQNEVGTIYPLAEACAIARAAGVAVFCDATQAAGKVELAFDAWGVTALCFSAHKIAGPKGVGALVVERGVELDPVTFGGSHERGVRPGTLNVPGIAGMGEACRLRRADGSADEARVGALRDRLEHILAESVPGLVVNGDRAHRLAGNLHVSVPDVPNGAVVARLRTAVALSTGSACTSGAPSPSHVLRAMGLPEWRIAGALRFGLGPQTTGAEISRAAALVERAVVDVRAVMARYTTPR